MAGLYQYLVEGPCEAVLLKALMHMGQGLMPPGKVDVFNATNELVSLTRLRTFKRETKIVLVYDTDKEGVGILNENIARFARYTSNELYHLQSVRNFEDEFVRACPSIRSVLDVFHTKSVAEFKSRLISHKDLPGKLESLGFDVRKMWRTKAPAPFDRYASSAETLKTVLHI